MRFPHAARSVLGIQPASTAGTLARSKTSPGTAFSAALRLLVHRLFCGEPSRKKLTFGERMPEISAYARKTSRLAVALVLIAFELDGGARSRLPAELGLLFSRDVLVRRIWRSPLQMAATRRSTSPGLSILSRSLLFTALTRRLASRGQRGAISYADLTGSLRRARPSRSWLPYLLAPRSLGGPPRCPPWRALSPLPTQ